MIINLFSYFFKDESTPSIHLIINSLLENNTAIQSGGAIKITGRRASYLNSTFKSNIATYGIDEASYPVNIMLKVKKIKKDANHGSNNFDEELIYSSYIVNDLLLLSGVRSGGSSEFLFEFNIVDINNEIVNNLDGG